MEIGNRKFKKQKNPGVLVIENKYRYFLNRAVGEEGNRKYVYHCTRRGSCKGSAVLLGGIDGDVEHLIVTNVVL